MKTTLACIILLTQLIEVCAELTFRQLTERQTLELSCSPRREHGSLTGLQLYHRGPRSQTTLLSLVEGSSKVRVDPEHRERLLLCGGLDSLQVNATLSHLRPSDSGLYMWELSYGQNSSDRVVLGAHRVFLLVDGAGRSSWCSPRYRPLLLTISTAAGLLLLTLSWLAVQKCVKARRGHRSQPPLPIYEEMTRKQQRTGTSQNNQEDSLHLEEVSFPVYANPNMQPQQDNYYACPRQLALTA